MTALAARPDAVVFAGARDPTRADSLHTFANAHSERVHVIKVVSADKENNKAAVEEIKRVAGRLDVVIANAGIGNTLGMALETSPADMVRHFEVRRDSWHSSTKKGYASLTVNSIY